jgi:hypothetical protein
MICRMGGNGKSFCFTSEIHEFYIDTRNDRSGCLDELHDMVQRDLKNMCYVLVIPL